MRPVTTPTSSIWGYGTPAPTALRRCMVDAGDLLLAWTLRGAPHFCRVCAATHAYKQPFPLSTLQAGLDLQPGTSPHMLRRIPGGAGPAKKVPERLDPVPGVLRLLGPADPRRVAGYLDPTVREVAAHWPEADAVGGVRLLGRLDLFLQGRDRDLAVPDANARNDLWRPLGRPGAVVAGLDWSARGASRRRAGS